MANFWDGGGLLMYISSLFRPQLRYNTRYDPHPGEPLISAPDQAYWHLGLGGSNPADPTPELVHVFMLPPVPLDVPAHLEWLRRNIAPARDRFVSREGEPLLGCQPGKLWLRDGTGSATVFGTGVGVYAISRSDGRTVLVAAILVREVGEWSEARVEVYEPGALPYFASVFDAIAAAFPVQARHVAAARAALAGHVAATWHWVSFPSPVSGLTEPAAQEESTVPQEPVGPQEPVDPQEPVVPRPAPAQPAASAARAPDTPQSSEPARDSDLATWFEWREAMRRAGYKVTLETIAQKAGYSHGYVKHEHALWRAGRPADL